MRGTRGSRWPSVTQQAREAPDGGIFGPAPGFEGIEQRLKAAKQPVPSDDLLEPQDQEGIHGRALGEGLQAWIRGQINQKLRIPAAGGGQKGGHAVGDQIAQQVILQPVGKLQQGPEQGEGPFFPVLGQQEQGGEMPVERLVISPLCGVPHHLFQDGQEPGKDGLPGSCAIPWHQVPGALGAAYCQCHPRTTPRSIKHDSSMCPTASLGSPSSRIT